jgi:hypothetical protein
MPRLSEIGLTRERVVSLCIRYNVPVHNAGGLHNYFANHIEPGSFLYAIITNDLRAACALADETNRHHIYDVVHLLVNEAESGTWGSLYNVNDWLAKRTEEAASRD